MTIWHPNWCAATVHLKSHGALSDPRISQIPTTMTDESAGVFLYGILADARLIRRSVQVTRRFVDQSGISGSR
jgi:hypothetical protein